MIIGAMIAITAVASPLAAQLRPPQVQLGPAKTFRNWYAGCDNAGDCLATVLPDNVILNEQQRPSTLILTILRPAGSDGVAELQLSHWDWDETVRTPLIAPQLLVDGQAVPLPLETKQGQFWTAPLSPAVAAMLAQGREARLVGKGGTAALRASLSGAKAAMLFLDAQQGRAGGVTALVARGPQPATTVPPAKALPVIYPAASSIKTPSRPSSTDVQRLMRANECDLDYEGDDRLGLHRLDPTHTLVAIRCGAGAYNVSHMLYVLSEGSTQLVPAVMDYDGRHRGDGAAPMLTNYDWDEKSARLSQFAKARGLGDCGESAEWVWDGSAFRLVQQSAMEECAGTSDWPTLWRANIKKR